MTWLRGWLTDRLYLLEWRIGRLGERVDPGPARMATEIEFAAGGGLVQCPRCGTVGALHRLSDDPAR